MKSALNILNSMNILNLDIRVFYALVIYIVINAYAFALMGIDKNKSKRRRVRTSELKFFIVSFLFGALGSVMGMTVFRHKTQKEGFYMGIPALFLLNVLVLSIMYKFIIVRGS